jgi:ESS family glutamate:Na+ symporter
MQIGPFALLLLAVPVLLLGEVMTRRIAWLRASNIPPPIAAGLIVSLLLLLGGELFPGAVTVQGSTDHPVWSWIVSPAWGLVSPRPTDVERPLLILFFTCIGLNASWRLARQGGKPLLVYLALAAAIALIQAVSGAATAIALGEKPLLGLMTSTVSLMGGFGTAAGFAPEFEKSGLTGAATIGLAAAAFGVIAGGLIAGLVGGRLVARQLGRTDASATPAAEGNASSIGAGFLGELRALARTPARTMTHLVILALCVKLGAFVSVFIQSLGITFPVYMGSMIVAALVRNLHDLTRGDWLKTECVDGIGGAALMWLLAVVMIDLQLAQLKHAALPMLCILAIQVALLAALAYWVVFRVMGRDYEAAVMSAGMIGFGLGATSNALASMRVLVERFGPAPKAFLIVPIVGAFLIDFANALITTLGLNLLK